jgi:hypothetical protein
MQVFNRHISPRGLTVFGFGADHRRDPAVGADARIVQRCRERRLARDASSRRSASCVYHNDLHDLTVVHSTTELAVRILQAPAPSRLCSPF